MWCAGEVLLLAGTEKVLLKANHPSSDTKRVLAIAPLEGARDTKCELTSFSPVGTAAPGGGRSIRTRILGSAWFVGGSAADAPKARHLDVFTSQV
jgi:hypothetical protein